MFELSNIRISGCVLYMESDNMTADLGTRRGAKLSDISENSSWISGQSWAKTDRSLFPIKSAEEIK